MERVEATRSIKGKLIVCIFFNYIFDYLFKVLNFYVYITIMCYYVMCVIHIYTYT